MNWIADIKMGHFAQQITLQEYVDSIKEQAHRVKRVTEQIQQLVGQWKFEPMVKAYQALRGVSLIVAVTTIAELGDLGRFKSPKQLMAYLGLVPSLHSSGPTTKRGSITKTGNGHVRKVLTEAAHAYRYPARQSRVIVKRLDGVPEQVRAIAWKAQVRLCGRFRRLSARGKQRNKVIIAIARELCGFMWAISQAVSVADQA